MATIEFDEVYEEIRGVLVSLVLESLIVILFLLIRRIPVVCNLNKIKWCLKI
jgi:hypothetical protein